MKRQYKIGVRKSYNLAGMMMFEITIMIIKSETTMTMTFEISIMMIISKTTTMMVISKTMMMMMMKMMMVYSNCPLVQIWTLVTKKWRLGL